MKNEKLQFPHFLSPISHNSGLTLVELIIVITIIGMLVTLGLAAYNDFTKTQKIRAAASDLKNNLRLAQNKALAQQKPATCSLFNGYQVVISSSSYEIQAFYHVETPAPANLTCSSSRSYPVVSGVSLSATNSPIYFWSLLGGATPSTITVSGFGKTPITLTVTKTGEIY